MRIYWNIRPSEKQATRANEAKYYINKKLLSYPKKYKHEDNVLQRIGFIHQRGSTFLIITLEYKETPSTKQSKEN